MHQLGQMGKVLKELADNNASKIKKLQVHFLEEGENSTRYWNPQNGALNHPFCGQSIRRVHGSFRMGWKERGNQPLNGRFWQWAGNYICKGIGRAGALVREPNLALGCGSADDGRGGSHHWTGTIRKRVPEIIDLQNGGGRDGCVGMSRTSLAL
ncbi:hypothetical protein CEXT_206811 [Caerostris extrusa]|uniref:Uncharacterized protein n=1 Tax=Caerostris extrusa TaxID=172846 RepID=A0AAV4R5M9_CAEEX|nr:hypothetical protein CEXT_206811 [Caerostris extrusa]